MRGRLGWVALVVAGVVALAIFAVLRFTGGDEPTDATTPPDTDIEVTEPTIPGAPEVEVVDRAEVFAVPVDGDITIDGAGDDWGFLDEAYSLIHESYREANIDQRRGEDSPGLLGLAFDDEHLYLLVVVEDDVYSNDNVGNQIWRGDAVDIHLSNVADPPFSPSPTEIQLTMTPRDAQGVPAFAWLVGTGADNFQDTSEPPEPPLIAGNVEDGAWILEAKMPWSLFQLDGPPLEVAAVFSVFDNDGEVMSSGRSAQTVVLSNAADAILKRPQTWGTFSADVDD